MARRCPECYAELPEDAVWVCPTCKYTLRIPAAAKAGIVFMVLGLALLGALLAFSATAKGTQRQPQIAGAFLLFLFKRSNATRCF